MSSREASTRGGGGRAELHVELAERDALLMLVRDVAVKMNEAATVEDALVFTLQRLCEFSGWQVGFAYRRGADGAALSPTAGFHSRREYQPLHEAIVRARLQLDETGRPWRNGSGGVVIGDLGLTISGQRALAERLDLRQVAIVPVRTRQESEPELVMEFFSATSTGLRESVGIGLESVVAQLQHLVRRERAYQLIESQSRELRTVLEAAADAFLIVDEEGALEDMNAAAERVFGPLADLDGARVSFLLPALSPLLPMRRALADIRSRGGLELDARDRAGKLLPVHVTVSESHAEQGTRYILALRDFRAIRQAQQRTVQQERLAAMGEMMTALAHESRNALQRLQSCLTLLELRGNAEVQSLVGDMQGAQDHLKRLYEEVRSYAAPLQLDVRPVDLVLLLEEVWWQLKVEWEPKGVTCGLGAGETGWEIAADRERLSQVLRNVLENAVHASPEDGRVQIDLAENGGVEERSVRIRVRDDGPGMGADVRQRAFDLLYTTKRGGTGMGLAISRRIVQEHGGEITLQSVPGEGTTVTIRLPHGEPWAVRGRGD